MIAAIVPAAGRSERMGRCKLTLRIGGRSVIERVIGALRDGGADPVVVVTGLREVQQIAESVGVVVWLNSQTGSMRETVERGFDWFEVQPFLPDAWLLMPADYPHITADPVRMLCDHFRRQPSNSILMPIYNGSRGHPILIPWRHVAAIRAMPTGNGIDDYVRRASVVEIPVSSPAVLHDVDTPSDLTRADRLEADAQRGAGPSCLAARRPPQQ